MVSSLVQFFLLMDLYQNVHTIAWHNPGSMSILSESFSLYLHQLSFQEKVAEDALKYPPLLNAKVLLSKTSLYIPGVMNQLLYVLFSSKFI